MYESYVKGVRRRGKPGKCWMDGVKEVLARKGLNIQEAKFSIIRCPVDSQKLLRNSIRI